MSPTNSLSKPFTKHLSLLLTGMALGWGVFSFLSFSQPEWAQQASAFQLAGILAGVLAAYLFTGLAKRLDQKIPWPHLPGSRFFLGTVLLTLLGLAVILLFWLAALTLVGQPFALDAYTYPLLLKALILSGVISMAYNAAYFALYSYLGLSRAELTKITLQKEQTQLQLQALKEQLSPHFLFNNLNTVSALLTVNPQQAEEYVYRLGECYQKALRNNQKPLNSLSQELELLRAYEYLLSTRFGGKFQLKIELDPVVLDRDIPPLTLQLLVENALKHNRLSSADPLKINIKNKGPYLIVSNLKAPLEQPVRSFNVGLKNITARYQLLAHKKVVIEDSKYFTVKLPIL